MKRLLLFGGTTEGRRLSLEAAELGWDVTVSVATAYGVRQLDPHPGLTVLAGRLEAPAMAAFLRRGRFDAVVDATHPYAAAVSANIRAACEETGAPLLRLLREEGDEAGCQYFDTLTLACRAAGLRPGVILAATGSKELAPYLEVSDWRSRVFLRVLPTEESVARCLEAGFSREQLVAAEGPFSLEENLALMRSLNVRTLVTKDGGTAGGFEEKKRAALACGAAVLVVRRPWEHGLSYEQVLDFLKGGL